MPRFALARNRAVSFAAVVAVSAGAGALAAVMALSPSPEPARAARDLGPPAAVSSGERPDDFAQSYSPYCQTAQGVCTLPSALPIGSPCDCGGTPGRVIP